MKALVSNGEIIVVDPTPEVERDLVAQLSFEDKAKKYQIKRMSHNTFSRLSPLFKKLQSEVNQCLVEKQADGSLKISSGFYNLVKGFVPEIIDQRCDTGKKVVYPWVKKPHDLRDYQQEAVELMTQNYRGLINFATGLGKTLTAVHAVRAFSRKTLIVCPSNSVAKQFYKELVEAFGDARVGFFGGGKKKIREITVGIAGSVNNSVDLFRKEDLGLIIIDEVHHVPASTFFSIASALGTSGRLFGLTATDYRSDGKDLMITAGCGDVLIRRDVVWGVQAGWLAQPYFIVREVPTTGENYRNDKLKNYKEHILGSDVMRDRIRNDALGFINAGKSVLVLVDEVEHGRQLSEELGVPFATGEDKQSQTYVDALNEGKIPGLVGTDSKIGEGTDTKRVDVLILANFVASRGPVMQAIGRGLRKYGNKTVCIVLDYIPTGSEMLTRHAMSRIGFYRDITDKVQVIEQA